MQTDSDLNLVLPGRFIAELSLILSACILFKPLRIRGFQQVVPTLQYTQLQSVSQVLW